MGRRHDIIDWLQTPIIVLPVTFLAFFVLLLPFLLAGVEDAAKFYGAFFAAITGLAGVVVGAMVNASLNRRRDERLERIKVLAAARIATSEVDQVKEAVRWVQTFFETHVKGDAATGYALKQEDLWTLNRLEDKLARMTVADKHVLELSLQSTAIATQLTAIKQDREDFTWLAQTINGQLTEDGSIDVFAYEILKARLSELTEHTTKLADAFRKFLDEHSGDFA